MVLKIKINPHAYWKEIWYKVEFKVSYNLYMNEAETAQFPQRCNIRRLQTSGINLNFSFWKRL